MRGSELSYLYTICIEQLVRGVKLRLECRCTENILPKKVYLEISNAGQVRASTNDQGEETILTIIPVNVREVAIYHPATGHFLGMDAEGKLMASVSFGTFSYVYDIHV